MTGGASDSARDHAANSLRKAPNYRANRPTPGVIERLKFKEPVEFDDYP